MELEVRVKEWVEGEQKPSKLVHGRVGRGVEFRDKAPLAPFPPAIPTHAPA